MDILPFLIWPFVASLILTGIHAYLGVSLVERGVIFVDTGAGADRRLARPLPSGGRWIRTDEALIFLSLGFTFLGPAFFALARQRDADIFPRNAFIGIAYCRRFGDPPILRHGAKPPGETEHSLKDMLVVGISLAVSRARSDQTAVLYGVMPVFFTISHRKSSC